MVHAIKWAYGVTTVPSRRAELLPLTLRSLSAAGFDKPKLFVDGSPSSDAASWESEFGLEVVTRYPAIRCHGNWVLSLYELFIRNPTADRYALFQDDFVTYKNLRKYLEACPYPGVVPDGTGKYKPATPGVTPGYWNLYTFPENQQRFPMEGLTGRRKYGWMESNQCGLGAVALVFSREAVIAVIGSRHMTERPMDPERGWKKVDGGIVESMVKANDAGITTGWREYVHHPSLVQHIGRVSTVSNPPHQQAPSFRGEEFDAMELIRETALETTTEK